MRSACGTNPGARAYRQPAPWGALVFTESFGGLWSIEPSLKPLAAPDAAPEAIADVMGLTDEVLETCRLLTPDELARLLATPRLEALSPFAKSVLAFVATIPAGDFLTYAEVADAVQTPKAARAVGNVLSSNPFPILIPCHRVVKRCDRTRFDILAPASYHPALWLGSAELSGVAAWLRLHDLACAA